MSIKEMKEVVRRYGNRLELQASSTAVEKYQLEEIAR
jgi:hypothetical protein